MINPDALIPNKFYIVTKASPCDTFKLHDIFYKNYEGWIFNYTQSHYLKSAAYIHPDNYSNIQFEFKLKPPCL